MIAKQHDPRPTSERMTLRDFFFNIYAVDRLRHYSTATRMQYVRAIDHLCRHAGKEVAVSELSDTLVTRCLKAMVAAGKAPVTANKVRHLLLALWQFAYRRHLISEEPKWNLPFGEVLRALTAVDQRKRKIGLTLKRLDKKLAHLRQRLDTIGEGGGL